MAQFKYPLPKLSKKNMVWNKAIYVVYLFSGAHEIFQKFEKLK